MSRLGAGLARLFGRDGVVSVAVVVAFLVAWLPAFGWSSSTTGAVAAALVAVGGFVSAALVSVDRALPALVGVGQAVIAAVISFGVHLPANWVGAIMAALAVIAGLTTRPQVGAKQPPRDRDGHEVDRNGWRVGELDTTTTRTAESFERSAKPGWGPQADVELRDAPPLPTDPGTPGRLIERGEFVTETFPSVADRPAAEHDSGQQERGRKGRHWRDQDFRPKWGDLGPELGA